MFNGLTKGLITLRRLSLECDNIDVLLYSLMFKCQINKEIPLLNTKENNNPMVMPLCQHWGGHDRRTVNLKLTCATFREIEIEIIGYIDKHICTHAHTHTYTYIYRERGKGEMKEEREFDLTTEKS